MSSQATATMHKAAHIPKEPGRGLIKARPFANTNSKLARSSFKSPARQYHHTIPAQRPSHSVVNSNQNEEAKNADSSSAIFHEGITETVGNVLGPIKKIGKNALKTTNSLVKDSGSITGSFAKRLLTDTSPGMMKARTWVFGLGGLVFAYQTLKSAIEALKLFYGRKKDDFSPWVHIFSGLLNGGAAASFLAPFFGGLRNPATKIKDGKLAIDPLRLGGVIAAPILMKTVMAISQGQSIFNKIFRIIGIDLTEVFRPPFEGVNWVTNANDNPGGAQGVPGGGAGANPLAGLTR